MSMVATFTQVTPGELQRLQEDPQWLDGLMLVRDEEPDRADGYLDKAWDGLDFLFDAQGVPLRLQEDGAPLGRDMTHFGWTAESISKMADLLRQTPFETLAAHYDPEQMNEDVYGSWADEDDDLDYLRQYYEVLSAFCESSCASGSAAILEFTY